MEMEPRAESIVLDQAEISPFWVSNLERLASASSLSRRGRATAGTKSSLHGGQPANSRRSLRGFFQASVLLLQHSLDFYAAPHCGADCLVASRGYQ
jgi:hypothetical protein